MSSKDYYLNNRDEVIKRAAKFAKENPEKVKGYKNKWIENNPTKQAESGRKYREINSERLLAESRKRYANNIEAERERSRLYRLNNKKVIALRKKVKLKNNPEYRLRENLRNRIRVALRTGKGKKSSKTEELLGASLDFVRDYLTKLLLTGMTWKNYGVKTWHIDHIIPCDLFDLSDPTQQRKCFHYTNLQPLWALNNIQKSNKLV